MSLIQKQRDYIKGVFILSKNFLGNFLVFENNNMLFFGGAGF